jgi:hypothetical protein
MNPYLYSTEIKAEGWYLPDLSDKDILAAWELYNQWWEAYSHKNWQGKDPLAGSAYSWQPVFKE